MIKINKIPKILVVGDLMIDEYLWGSCDRISPEAPVQIVDIKKESEVLGGAGNVISNLVSLGAKVCAFSVIGDDEVGLKVKSILKEKDVETFLIEEKGRKTSKKTRLMASHSQVVRYDKESKEEINNSSQKHLFESYKKQVALCDIVLLSDYAKGVLTKSLVEKLISEARKKEKKVLVDPKGKDFSKYKKAYFLVPNKKEAQEATGVLIQDDRSLEKALKLLKEKFELELSLITLSENGIAIYENNKVSIKPTVAKEVFDVTGAGDTVLASLGFALSLGNDINTSVEFANIAAGIVVGKLGSATTCLDEIEEYQENLNGNQIQSHIKTFEQMGKISLKLKKENKKIIFTNGCFDILHKGHVSYLNTAKSFGDVLILGLNSDESIKRLKGQTRPINSQEDRAFILAALACVDYVVIFDEDTPYELINVVKPDILVKGADYKNKEIIGSNLVKETRLVEFIDNKSTTNIINKIKGK